MPRWQQRLPKALQQGAVRQGNTALNSPFGQLLQWQTPRLISGGACVSEIRGMGSISASSKRKQDKMARKDRVLTCEALGAFVVVERNGHTSDGAARTAKGGNQRKKTSAET